MSQLPGKLGVLQALLAGGVVPNLYAPDLATLRGAATACVEGGCPVLEVTNRGEGAIEAFRELLVWARSTHPTLLLGAGTVTEPQTAAAYINAGARFHRRAELQSRGGEPLQPARRALRPGLCDAVGDQRRARRRGVAD